MTKALPNFRDIARVFYGIQMQLAPHMQDAVGKMMVKQARKEGHKPKPFPEDRGPHEKFDDGQEIIDFVARHQPISPVYVAEALGFSESRAYQKMRRLANEGRLKWRRGEKGEPGTERFRTPPKLYYVAEV